MIDFIKKRPYISIGILIILVVVCVIYGTFLIQFIRYYTTDEEGILVKKGRLAPGISSGLQELSSANEGHVYTYEGMSGETIRIYATTPSDVFLVITVYAPGREWPLREYFVDLEGQRGDDVEIIETLPVDGIYEIYVDMADISGKYEIQVDVIE